MRYPDRKRKIPTLAWELTAMLLIALAAARFGASRSVVVILLLSGTVWISYTAGRWPGILSALAGAAVFLLLSGGPSAFDGSLAGAMTGISLLIASLAFGLLTSRVKKRVTEAENGERRNEALYRLGEALMRVTGRTELVRTAIERLDGSVDVIPVGFLAASDGSLGEAILGAPGESEPEPGERPADRLQAPGERKAIRWAFEHGEAAGTGTGCFPECEGWYLPLVGSDAVMGIFGCLPAGQGRLDPEERTLLQAFAAQLALALDREHHAEQLEEARILVEGEKLKTSLLRSISHDLRTPLAGIAGASSTLLSQGEHLDEETRTELLASIFDEANWLSAMVDNLLSLTRIQGRDGLIRKEPEVLDDVIVSTVQRVGKRLANHRLQVHVPEQLTMVPMDGNLIEQVLINLLDNAVKYTPPQSRIQLSAVRGEGEVIFSVGDNGPGIPTSELDRVFDLFTTGRPLVQDGKRGAGLGLGICRAIVQAHGGRIRAENLPEGGARISFTLPAGDDERTSALIDSIGPGRTPNGGDDDAADDSDHRG